MGQSRRAFAMVATTIANEVRLGAVRAGAGARRHQSGRIRRH
jgi:hypothetical protein